MGLILCSWAAAYPCFAGTDMAQSAPFCHWTSWEPVEKAPSLPPRSRAIKRKVSNLSGWKNRWIRVCHSPAGILQMEFKEKLNSLIPRKIAVATYDSLSTRIPTTADTREHDNSHSSCERWVTPQPPCDSSLAQILLATQEQIEQDCSFLNANDSGYNLCFLVNHYEKLSPNSQFDWRYVGAMEKRIQRRVMRLRFSHNGQVYRTLKSYISSYPIPKVPATEGPRPSAMLRYPLRSERESRSRYDEALHGLSPSRRWILWIDKKYHPSGPEALEDDAGYGMGMSSCFSLMRKSLLPTKPVDLIIFIRKLHDRCITNVIEDWSKRPFKKGFRNEGGGYGFQLDAVEAEAKEEWEEENLIKEFQNNAQRKLLTQQARINETICNNLSRYLAFYVPGSHSDGGTIKVNYKFVQSPICNIDNEYMISPRSKLQQIIGQWNKNIKNAKASNNQDSMLVAIARFIRSLEILHVFEDGNQRTLVFALLNKLLIENGFYPTILDDPTIFDGYLGVERLVQEIKKGIHYYLTVTTAFQESSQIPNRQQYRPSPWR